MARKRALTEAEREQFELALADARPLKKAPRRSRKPTKPQSAQTIVPVKKETPSATPPRIGRNNVGIDGNTAGRLRRGQIEPHARLDLHGLTERAAHRALVTFLHGARLRKLRLVLIVTGKGGSSAARQQDDDSFNPAMDAGKRGILRIMTPRWLKEPGLADFIVDVREAHRHHGGSGALYVYLRKQQQA